MLGHHCTRKVTTRKEVKHYLLASRAAKSLVAQVFEQGLAMDQRERNREELCFLTGREELDRDPPHEGRMLVFPAVVEAGIIENAGCNALVVRFTRWRRVVQAALRFFHESIVAQAP